MAWVRVLIHNGRAYSWVTPLKTQLRLLETPSGKPARKPPEGAVAASRLRSNIYALVYRQMHALAGRAQDLDDLVQLAAEQVFRSLPYFEERSAPETWTYRICYNTLMNQRRWYRRWLQRFTMTRDDYFSREIDQTHPQSADLLEQRERAERMWQALDQIPSKRRAVVILHDLDELDIDEIAAIVGANVSTVRSRLRDGRRLLAQALERDPYFSDQACGQEAT